MDISHGARRRRSRAVLGCAAIAVMVSLGLPSLTAVASDDAEPPPTAPSAEPLVEGTETTVAETTVPDTTVPDTTVPDTTVPDTTVPDTTVPDTTVPDTTVPDTTVPDTTVPETTVPETTVPEGTEGAAGGTDATAPTTTASTATAPTTTAPIAEEASISLMGVVPQVFGLSATQTVDDQGTVKYRIVTISWSGTPGAEYVVERQRSTSGAWEWVGSGWDGSTSTTQTFSEGDTFGWYRYRVTPSIYDDDIFDYVFGSPSYVSVNVTKVAYPPSLPRTVRVTRTGSTAKVTWTAPTTADYTCQSTGYFFCDPATSYIMSWKPAGGTWQRATTSGTSHTISGLRAATTYYVTVRAVNAAGRSGTTTSVRIAPLAKPSVMSLRATPAFRQITLRWTAPANNGSPIIRYVIQRRRADLTTWTFISTTTPATARSITSRNLANGTRYFFRIAAVNALGRGAWSAPIGALTASHRLDVNIILVGRELFTAAEIAETNAAVAMARTIFAQVGIYLRVAGNFGLTAAQAGANLTIDNEAEAVDLTADHTIANRALDLFVVRRFNWSSVVGVSAVDGSCDKNDNTYGRMSGAVASLNTPTVMSGIVFAHEMGHYLGLYHSYDFGNLMYPAADPSNTGIQQSQGDVMKRHCNVTRL